MSEGLEIFDGTPHWWNSPDIWVVPGIDPTGAAGSPVAGQPAYVWARVHNTTSHRNFTEAQVNFFWSNPATGVLRSNSISIGSAYVDLNADEIKEVLCLVPWIPVIVNNGHECLVAEVRHRGDPLPVPLPDPFAPQSYHQVAQKNLNVVVMRTLTMHTFMIQLAPPKRHRKNFVLYIERGGELDELTLKQLGLAKFRPVDADFEARLSDVGGCDERGEEKVGFQLDAGMTRPLYLKVFPHELAANTYTLLHVIARDGEEIFGGISYVFVNDINESREEK